MRVLVIGLGSMGRRRVRLLKKINPEIDIIGVDQNAERAMTVQDEYGIEVCDNLAEALDNGNAEYAVVCTAPGTHADIICQCLQSNLHVFTELNLISDKYEENMALARERDKVLFLSSTFLYREEIGFIAEQVQNVKSRLNYSYHVGQYLPDWHPWEKISDYFVSDKRTNGCREILAIELPWLIQAFGEIVSVEVLSGKNTELCIDYMDNYLLLIQHSSGHKGMLAVDVMSRKAVRNLEVFGEDLYLSWDGTPDGLKIYDWKMQKEKSINLYERAESVDGYAVFVIENAYENELRVFFAETANAASAKYTFRDDLLTLAWIDRIEGNG